MIEVQIGPSTKLNGDYSAYISFHYSENIINTIKKLPFREYDPKYNDWEIPIEKVEWLQNKLFPTKFNIIDKQNILHNYKKEKFELPEGFKFKTKPFRHQVEAVEYGLKYDKWFLGDEQGLGKTFQVINIAIARKIKYGYKHCLIVCGVNTLKWNWVNEIHTHSNEDGYILGQRFLKNGNIKIGSTKDKLADLKHDLLENDNLPYFIITNVESFRTKEIAETIKKLCDKNIINMCAVDEFHKCKTPTSQQTKGLFKCLPKCRIAMTGTPLMNSPLDLFSIFKWLGYENHSYTAFKTHYCIMGGFGGYEVVGYRYMEELQNKLSEIMVRRLKEDVFDLPDKIFVDEYVEMTKDQEKIYKEVQTDLRQNIDKIASAINPLSELIRLRQATGYTGILSTTIQESSKLDRMEELVEEAISNNRKVVIFSNWTQMTDAIYMRLSKYMPALITGETKDTIRQSLVDEFQTNNGSKIIIGTIGAMGTGLTLSAGTVVIFLDHPWTKAIYDQAVDRCHRIGQKNNITIYNLMCKNSIDERIWTIVQNKGKMSDQIIDGKIEGNKAELINYLIG